MEITEITKHRIYVRTRYGEVGIQRLKEMGAHWDPQRKAWWVGRKLLDRVEKIVANEQNHQLSDEAKKTYENQMIEKERENLLGTAEYKGRTYFIVKEGRSARGPYFKLMFRDGSKSFFADAAQVAVRKRFARPTPLSLLQSDRRSRSEDDLEYRTCWECGRSFTRRDAARNGGDWWDSYCGC